MVAKYRKSRKHPGWVSKKYAKSLKKQAESSWIGRGFRYGAGAAGAASGAALGWVYDGWGGAGAGLREGWKRGTRWTKQPLKYYRPVTGTNPPKYNYPGRDGQTGSNPLPRLGSNPAPRPKVPWKGTIKGRKPLRVSFVRKHRTHKSASVFKKRL